MRSLRPSRFPVATLVERDGGDDREEDTVRRRSQAGVENALDGDGDQTGDGRQHEPHPGGDAFGQGFDRALDPRAPVPEELRVPRGQDPGERNPAHR